MGMILDRVEAKKKSLNIKEHFTIVTQINVKYIYLYKARVRNK